MSEDRSPAELHEEHELAEEITNQKLKEAGIAFGIVSALALLAYVAWRVWGQA